MGQKVHPIGLRLGIIKTWDSRWFSQKNYAALLHEDIKIRKIVKERLMHAGVSKVEIERAGQKAKINIHTARPGIIIGKKGAEVDRLKEEIQRRMGREVYIKIDEIHRPEIEAQIVAESIGLQLTKRVAFRRAGGRDSGGTSVGSRRFRSRARPCRSSWRRASSTASWAISPRAGHRNPKKPL